MSDNTNVSELPGSFVLCEYPDVDTLEKIWRNELILPNDQLRLLNYKDTVKKSGYARVTYQRKTYNNHYYGRYFPCNSQVLWGTYQWRAIRAALFGKGHLDIDIVNCHPTLVAQLYTKLTGKTAAAVEEYVENRDKIIKQTFISQDAIDRYNEQAQDCLTKKDFVKNLFTLTLYGGNVNTWVRHFDLSPDEYELPPLYERFAKEVAEIREEVMRTNDEYYAKMRKNVKAAKGKLKPHKFLSLVLQDLEAWIVYTMIQQAQKDGVMVTSYMYDGFIIKGNLPLGYLEDLEELVYDRWGYEIKLTVKPFDRSIDLTRLPIPSIYLDNGYDYDSIDRADYAELDKRIRSVFALIKRGGRSYWVAKCIDDKTRDITYERVKFGSKEETSYKRIKFTGPDGKEFTLLDRLLALAPILSYLKEDFRPSLKYTPSKIFNMFTGFKHAFRTGEPTPEGLEGLEAFRKHILEVWAAGNRDHAAYIFGWLAHIIQRPSKRMDTALLIKSQPGAGKNVITEFLAKYVIGDKYYRYTGNIDDLFARFNSRSAYKLLTVVDETSTAEMSKKVTSDRLKSLITRTDMDVEYKGVEPICISDYNNYIFLTNRDDALPIEEGDRRFVVFECSNHLCGHIDDYFEPFIEKLHNDEAGYAVFRWLAEYDLSGFNPRKLPKTKLKDEMKFENLPFSIRMIIEALRGEYEVNWNIGDSDKVHITTHNLYLCYRDWCDRRGERPFGESVFGRHMNRILKTTRKRTGKGVQTSGWFDITLDELKKAVCKLVKIDDLFDLEQVEEPKEQPAAAHLAAQPADEDDDDEYIVDDPEEQPVAAQPAAAHLAAVLPSDDDDDL